MQLVRRRQAADACSMRHVAKNLERHLGRVLSRARGLATCISAASALHPPVATVPPTSADDDDIHRVGGICSRSMCAPQRLCGMKRSVRRVMGQLG